MWEVWKARNASIFSNFLQKYEVIYLKFLITFSDWNKESFVRRRRCFYFPSLLQEHPMGFFDGTASNGECGVVFVIKLGKDKVMKRWLKAGFGRIIRA